jgi:hypothetical protein
MAPGVVRNAGQRATAHATPAEFGCGGLADDNGASRSEPLDEWSVGRGRLRAAGLGARPGRHARNRNQILDRHRQTVQRPDRAATHQRCLRGPRAGHRAIRVQIGEGIDHRLQPRDPVEHGGH